jgi:hypothetical protein
MLEKVVSLGLGGEAEASGLQVEVWTDVPGPQVRLRLWDELGRTSEPAERVPGRPGRWSVPPARRGCTLTWSIRLASPGHSHFQLRLQVLRDEVPLSGGSFAYSGPLEGMEERRGRFHFEQ